jgi:type IV secretory pathway VirB10-like protein
LKERNLKNVHRKQRKTPAKSGFFQDLTSGRNLAVNVPKLNDCMTMMLMHTTVWPPPKKQKNKTKKTKKNKTKNKQKTNKQTNKQRPPPCARTDMHEPAADLERLPRPLRHRARDSHRQESTGTLGHVEHRLDHAVRARHGSVNLRGALDARAPEPRARARLGGRVQMLREGSGEQEQGEYGG